MTGLSRILLRAVPLLTLSLLANTATLAASRSDEDATAQRLFRIERSLNANIVAYDALVLPDGKLDSKKPVVAYWELLAEHGDRKKLSTLHKRAYGFKTAPVDDGAIVMKMTAGIDRDITVAVVNGLYRAVVRIGDHAAVLERIYVKAVERKILWPSVQFLDLFGVDPTTGEPCYERIYP